MPGSTLSDAVTARALSLALHPAFDVERAGAALASLGTPHALRHALARVQRAIGERPSRVGVNAASALESALARVAA